MKFQCLFSNEILKLLFHSAALHLAVEKENVEIVKLLLACENIKVNLKNISKIIIFNTI